MGLFSKLRRGRGKVKFSDNFFYNPRREKLRAFFDKKIQADLARAQKNPLGLGALLPSVQNKVPLAPVFAGMPMPQMVGQPQIFPQPIPRVPVEENISQISTPGFAMRDMQMNMMEPRMMMANGDVALSEEAATDSLDSFLNADPEQLRFGIKSRISSITADQIDALKNGDMDTYNELGKEKRMLEKRMAEIIIEMGRQKMIEENPYNLPFDPDARAEVERRREEVRPLLEEEYRRNPYNYPFNKISIEERKRRREEGFSTGDEALALAYDDGVIQITEKELDDYSRNYLARNREMATALGLTVDDIRAQSLEAIRRKKETPLMEGGKYNPSENPRRVPEFAAGDEVNVEKLPKGLKAMYESGPKGREGVKNIAAKTDKFAEGDEVSMMMMEMDQPAEMPEEGMEDVDMLMDEVADVAPAAQMLDQYVNMVIEMVQAGASEEEIIQMLVEAGLDEEDINAVFQAVIEALEGPSIDSELAALG